MNRKSIEFKLVNGIPIKLGHILNKQISNVDDEEKLRIARFIDKALTYLSSFSSIKRVRQANKMVDHAIKISVPPEPVSCRKGLGCNGCCHINVDVFSSEAKTIVKKRRAKVMSVLDKIKEQAKIPRGEVTATPVRCVFLEDNGLCGIYEDRPLACRKYFVVSNPKYCDVQQVGEHSVRVYSVPQAEVIDGAMYQLEEADSMARMVLKYVN